MFIAADRFIVLKSNHLVQSVDSAFYGFWDIVVKSGHEESRMKNLPRKTFASLLVCVTIMCPELGGNCLGSKQILGGLMQCVGPDRIASLCYEHFYRCNIQERYFLCYER